ncbi:hypothetical protein CIT25_13850 [Mesorhizobium mediterraneum]|uniref:Uncharacterized protein n=1 Tax=Mesorhizobium mediterraneum TaxID=43617 RepID=A0AB36RA10_9HYPH|nr:hypothetical protein CIT25_13850 [Mesorhizobium mediterraneum]
MPDLYTIVAARNSKVWPTRQTAALSFYERALEMTNRSGLEANAEGGLNNPTQHNVDPSGDALAEVAVRLVTESPAQTASDLTN